MTSQLADGRNTLLTRNQLASALTEAMGAVGQLPPMLAAWAPDTVFGFLGLYFFLKMPT